MTLGRVQALSKTQCVHPCDSNNTSLLHGTVLLNERAPKACTLCAWYFVSPQYMLAIVCIKTESRKWGMYWLKVQDLEPDVLVSFPALSLTV